MRKGNFQSKNDELDFRRLLAERISYAIRVSGLSPAEIASSVRVDRKSLANWCSGATVPKVIDLWKLSVVLQKPIEWFFAAQSTVETLQKELDVLKIKLQNTTEMVIERERMLAPERNVAPDPGPIDHGNSRPARGP
jgi:transcriptional regulator with XRE-family HTH domain